MVEKLFQTLLTFCYLYIIKTSRQDKKMRFKIILRFQRNKFNLSDFKKILKLDKKEKKEIINITKKIGMCY